MCPNAALLVLLQRDSIFCTRTKSYQAVLPCIMISSFIFHCLDSVISQLSKPKFQVLNFYGSTDSFVLDSVCNTQDRFSFNEAKYWSADEILVLVTSPSRLLSRCLVALESFFRRVDLWRINHKSHESAYQ